MVTEKDTINQRGESVETPMLWEVATQIVLDALIFKPANTFRRLASRSHAPKSLPHQPQGEIK